MAYLGGQRTACDRTVCCWVLSMLSHDTKEFDDGDLWGARQKAGENLNHALSFLCGKNDGASLRFRSPVATVAR